MIGYNADSQLCFLQIGRFSPIQLLENNHCVQEMGKHGSFDEQAHYSKLFFVTSLCYCPPKCNKLNYC